MYESVNKNGGFYIGRYETGTTTSRTNTSNGTTDVLVQMNKPVYNYVTWGPSMVSTVGDVTYSGKNQGKGAVELSRNMYKTSTSVVSTLCYGVQWDATLRFIATNPEHVTFPTDSTGKGHHTYPLSETGCYAVNNIYDMAGNASEWTMESYGTSNRVLRGGGYWLDPADSPAGMRTMSRQPKYVDNVYGFRIALYIK